MIKSVLDVDLYKLTMMQMAWVKHRDVTVRYELINRHAYAVRLAEYINQYSLRASLYAAGSLRFTSDDRNYLRRLGLFREDFLDALEFYVPTIINVSKTFDDQLSVWTEGPWWRAILWETMVLSVVNEMYNEEKTRQSGFEHYVAWSEGARRLYRKLATLDTENKTHYTPLQIVDFGTRRRYSSDWQGFVLDMFKTQCPEMLVGTSNVHYAREFGLKPVGTYAHEMDMVYTGILDPNTEEEYALAHRTMMRDWEEMYPTLLTGLTDTLGTDFFFKHSMQFGHWNLRQDSGDPLAFVDAAVKWWEEQGEAPSDHTIVFSDGLNLRTIIDIDDKCWWKDVNPVFGWGTNLMNDCGNRPISIVMKATEVEANGFRVKLVKLSDNVQKALGPAEKVEEIQQLLNSGGKENKVCVV